MVATEKGTAADQHCLLATQQLPGHSPGPWPHHAAEGQWCLQMLSGLAHPSPTEGIKRPLHGEKEVQFRKPLGI